MGGNRLIRGNNKSAQKEKKNVTFEENTEEKPKSSKTQPDDMHKMNLFDLDETATTTKDLIHKKDSEEKLININKIQKLNQTITDNNFKKNNEGIWVTGISEINKFLLDENITRKAEKGFLHIQVHHKEFFRHKSVIESYVGEELMERLLDKLTLKDFR
jgi:outer membrane cobalamin receptor